MKSTLALLCSTLVAVLPLHAGVILNGSFEQGLDNWTVQGEVILIDTYWQAADGVFSLHLGESGFPGSVSQIIDTVPGTSYKVSFWYSANPDWNDGLSGPTDGVTANLIWDGAIVGSISTSTAGRTRADMKWESTSFNVFASDSQSTIRFSNPNSGRTASTGPVIDNISIEAIVVPEPSTYVAGALLMLPFAIQAIRRFRK